MRFLQIVDRLSRAFLPWKITKHYVRPLLERRKQVPYDGRAFFESFYRASTKEEFSDGITVAPDYDPLSVRFHYNEVENLIVEFFAERRLGKAPRVLDVGSGAGHWIDFYIEVFGASEVTGVEIAASAVKALRSKYPGRAGVSIVEGDVSSPDFDLGRKFDVVNAIGVMFHIVDDERWSRAVANLGRHLVEGGIMVVGGQFGRRTANVQFHSTDHFESWNEIAAGGDVALVNKRIRSLKRWRRCARDAGLEVVCVMRARECKQLVTPENNVLFLRRRRG